MGRQAEKMLTAGFVPLWPLPQLTEGLISTSEKMLIG